MAEHAPQAQVIQPGHCRGCGGALPAARSGGVRCPSCRMHWLPEDLDEPQCGACAYPMRDLGRLAGQTPCPECGQPWPRSIPQPAVRWPGRGVMVLGVMAAPLVAALAAGAVVALSGTTREREDRFAWVVLFEAAGLLGGLSLAWAASQLVGVRSTLPRYRARSVDRLSQNLMMVVLGMWTAGLGIVWAAFQVR